MAQLVVAAAGAWLGGATLGTGVVAFGLTGTAIGWAVGSAVGSMLGPKARNEGPRLTDKRVIGTEYGQPIVHVEGHPRIAPDILWASERREISKTTEVGKGGGAEYTGYTYEVDLFLLLSENQLAGTARIWFDGELVYDPRISAGDAAMAASLQTERWSRLTFYDGDAAQLPDPTYEAAVGDAPAYRGLSTLFIEGLQLGESGRVPNITVEVFTSGETQEVSTVMLARFDGDGDDISGFDRHWSGGTQGYVPGKFGLAAYGARSIGGPSCPSTFTLAGVGEPFTVRFWFARLTQTASDVPGPPFWKGYELWGNDNAALRFSINDVSGTARLYATCNSSTTPQITGTTALDESTAPQHAEYSRDSSGIFRLFLNGVLQGQTASAYNNAITIPSAPALQIGAGVNTQNCWVDDIHMLRGACLHTADFTPPTAPHGLLNGELVSSIDDEDLDDVVSRLCLRAGLSAGQFDVTELASITKPVRALTVGVGATRAPLEMLATTHLFQCVLSGDKLDFRPRGGASVASIPYADLGASAEEGGAPEPFPLRLHDDIEAPASVAVSYINVDADYNIAVEQSDRLIWSQASIETVQLGLGMTGSEAKALADALLQDRIAARITAEGVSLLPAYTRIEPTDVFTVTAEDGTAYRMRSERKRDAAGLVSHDLVLDDASALTSVGLTSAYSGQTSVATPAGTILELMDIAILRDADGAMGLYAAVKGDASPYPGAELRRGLDGVTYETLAATFSAQAVIGTCSTTLGNWTGGNRFDDGNTVTVYVGDGTLSSATYANVLDAGANACLVGEEILQFKTATLIGNGQYRLSGLLRGRRGTEWAMAGHGASETFVLLQSTGLRRVELPASDLNAERHYKAVTLGRKLSTAEDVPFTCTGEGLKPFSPVDLRGERDGSGNLTGTFSRRTRLDLSWASTTAPPLGEETEAYEVDVYADGTYAVVERTISVTAETFSYSAADQTTDFGAPQATVYVGVFQISAAVGRGRELRGAI